MENIMSRVSTSPRPRQDNNEKVGVERLVIYTWKIKQKCRKIQKEC